jgi:hypothetical protein
VRTAFVCSAKFEFIFCLTLVCQCKGGDSEEKSLSIFVTEDGYASCTLSILLIFVFDS